MAVPKLIGTMRCACCGVDIPVKENDNGALNLSCAYCDVSAYAKKGTQAERLVRGRLKPLPGAEVAEEVAPAPAASSAPPPPADKATKKAGGLPWASK